MAGKIEKTYALIDKVIERETEKLSQEDRVKVFRRVVDRLGVKLCDIEVMSEDDGDEDRAA